MDIDAMIGKIVTIKIIKKQGNYYLAKEIKEDYEIYIEDEGDYLEEELINSVQKCIILEKKQGYLIGFLLSNRKFVNDMKKIERNIKNLPTYSNVKDIYLIERLKIKEKVVGLYFVEEEDIAKYYLGTTEIGTYIKKRRENHILFKENTIENELAKQIKDIVQSIDLNKKEISLREEQEKQKGLIEKALGLEMGREITRIATLDLKQKVYEKAAQANKKRLEEVERQKFFGKKKENTLKDVNIKQEMDTKDKVTDMKTLGQILQKERKLPSIKGDKFTKIGIIESDERDTLQNQKGKKAKVNTTRYSFVAITNNGKVIPLELEQDHTEGNNPRETNYQVNQKGNVQQDDVLSRFKIGEGTIAVKNGEYGEIKVYHSPRKTIGGNGIEGNKSLDTELETDNVWEIKKEERDLSQEYEDGYRSVEEGYQEAKWHEDNSGKIIKGDKMETKDVDGDRNTKSHTHDRMNFDTLAIKWGYYKEGKPNGNKAEELYEEKKKQNPKKEAKEIVEMITKDLEEEIGHSRDGRY